ncbi:uncharacterized protein LOC117253095 [Epinephelus lanceolatus]
MLKNVTTDLGSLESPEMNLKQTEAGLGHLRCLISHHHHHHHHHHLLLHYRHPHHHAAEMSKDKNIPEFLMDCVMERLESVGLPEMDLTGVELEKLEMSINEMFKKLTTDLGRYET